MKTPINLRLRWTWLSLLLGGWFGLALGQCAPRLEVVLADGSKVCLTDYAIAERRAPGNFASIGRVSNASSTYALSVSTPTGTCPAVFGWSNWIGSQLLQLGYTPNETNPSAVERKRIASGACQAELKNAGAPAGCTCVELLNDGRSPHDRAMFERLANLQASPLAPATAALSTAPVPAAVTPIPVPVKEARTSEIPAGQSSTPMGNPATREEVQTLQAQLAELRKQINQQAAGTASLARKHARARALVIGNGNYAQLGKLPNPPNDAQAVAEKFRRYGIEVDLVLDADRIGLVRALGEFQSRATTYDINILFYAGHGLQVDGVNYVIPLEMQVNGATAGSVKLNAISLSDALEYMPAKTRLVFLDACRDNPLSRSLRGTRSGVAAGLAPINTVTGTLVAYSTKDGSTAEDGQGRNSPYTEALLKHLDADTDIAIVLRRVRQSVLDATGGRQEPWEYGSLVGDQLVLSKLTQP